MKSTLLSILVLINLNFDLKVLLVSFSLQFPRSEMPRACGQGFVERIDPLGLSHYRTRVHWYNLDSTDKIKEP